MKILMESQNKINFRMHDHRFREMKWVRKFHRNHFVSSTTFLIIGIIFLTFVGPFIARFIQMEYYYRNFNYTEIMCQVAGNITTTPTKCCKDRVKHELYSYKKYALPLLIHSDVQNVPLNFDARRKWPSCRSIGTVRDQGSCGSCWAVAVASTITDRLCIHSEGRIATYISEQDLLTCCTNCGSGCDGGDPAEAWKYWKEYGIVSGGDYGSAQGCKPYIFPPCIHSNLKNCSVKSNTPDCHFYCQSNFEKNYWSDLSFGKVVYSLVSDERQMMTEIIQNGPIQTRITLYDDFLFYKSGIYQPKLGSRKISEHSVKIIGWGTDLSSSTDYWLVANSFNTDWGEDGFFRIKRGNTCNIEVNVFGGIPSLPELL